MKEERRKDRKEEDKKVLEQRRRGSREPVSRQREKGLRRSLGGTENIAFESC